MLVTAQRSGNRMTIAAASPEARALGLHPGMALTQARALVPGLGVRDADPEADVALLARLGLFAARRWTPRAALSGPDGLWLDLGGVAHLFGGERKMCERILAFCARLGLAARIAVAGATGAAHGLARFGADRLILCPEGGEAEALAPLPLAALRVEEDVRVAARRLGIDTIGDLIEMPRAPLERRFGPGCGASNRAFRHAAGMPRTHCLLYRLDQALGRVSEPFDPIVPEEPPSATLRLLEPIATAEAIGQVLAELVARLMRLLAESGLAARTLTLTCLRVDGEEQRVAIGTARASRDGAHLLRLLGGRIETIEPGFGIEAMRLVAGRCEPLGPQPVAGLLAGDDASPDLAPLIDRLAARLGRRRLFRISAVESDVPERSARRVGPLAAASSWPDWPRPVRLLSPPERVENVVALLPDQPPRRFTWRGRRHVVRQADGPERIHGEWWRRLSEAEAVRDYFQVEDEQGGRFWLYRRGDGLDDRTGDLSWYMHGVFG
jgi:protein ImuB